ncbi:MAG: hypothetical protein VX346_27145 [Planctomycetota bacterium]|nr:hypothetical protein [Planctomycetota bacterium]
MADRLRWSFSAVVCLALLGVCGWAEGQQALLSGHPRETYRDVEEIDAMEEALRSSLATRQRYSFSRSWWKWDRLRCRYVDGGRVDVNALKILRAVFRGLVLDWHARLQSRGEGDLLYLFFTTLKGDRNEKVLAVEDRVLLRDVHGGGYHGGWGGAARMRIYEELSRGGMLGEEERHRFRRIVFQSMERRIIDFEQGAQTANNHSFGNAGGVALALKLFPEVPQADAARAWIDRIWGHLSALQDWKEWNYYPYGPIFLHGMLDVAEATGRIESERALIQAVGNRCLGFVHGGGVRGNPNSGASVRRNLAEMYQDPWNVGYYDVEASARDGHFWYRLAQHYRIPEYLWAAEQVTLGGRPPGGVVPDVYSSAYQRRFAWFSVRDMTPRVPADQASVAYLSGQVARIPERLYLHSGRSPGRPFVAYFLYDQKDQHLDNVSGHLYEFSVNGAKFLHTSGKYNNTYSGENLKGGGTGEESLDLLLVLHKRHSFPLHPDRQGDQRDPLRRGSLQHDDCLVLAENNEQGDAFGRFGFRNYYGAESRWIRSSVLTEEGYLVVCDQFTGGPSLAADYRAGPVWHLASDDERRQGARTQNWFDAPALDHAWWQEHERRVVLYFHPAPAQHYGVLKQSHSQDVDPHVNHFAWRPIVAGETAHFVSLLVPHSVAETAGDIVARIKTVVDANGNVRATIGSTTVEMDGADSWSVRRSR